MLKSVQFPSPVYSPSDAQAAQSILTIIDALVPKMSASAKQDLLRAITERLQPIAVPQAGDVLGIVVQLIPRDRQWTVAELKNSLEQQGATIPEKQIHNAIGYLARKGHIQRLGYGKYIIDGVPVITVDDLGGHRGITEEDLDN